MYLPAMTSPPSEPGSSDGSDPLLGPSLAALSASHPLIGSSPEHGQSVRRLISLLNLLRYGLSRASQGSVDFPNTVAAVACFARSYQGIQASSLLCLTANYTEARTLIRSVYESAALGRTLAYESGLAEQWLHAQKWLPDKFAREYQKSFTIAEPDRNYRSYYQMASDSAHIVMKSTVPYAFDRRADLNLTFGPVLDADQLLTALREIVLMALFSCFCFRNAFVDPRLLPPEWHQDLAQIARDVSGKEMAHLEQDWEQHDRFLTEFAQHVRHSDELDDALNADPNSYDNIRGRMGQQPDS